MYKNQDTEYYIRGDVIDLVLRSAITIFGFTKFTTVEECLDKAVEGFQGMYADFRARRGVFRTGEISPTLAENMDFIASVIEDIRDNTPRPSTGPTRDYVLEKLKEVTQASREDSVKES